LAKSNGELVEKTVRLAGEFGRKIATPLRHEKYSVCRQNKFLSGFKKLRRL
jgi:hypothetical protein